MDLAGLNRALEAAGRQPLHYGPDPQRYRTLTPTTIEEPGDRGGVDVQRFADEDALCRHLLVGELGRGGPRPGAVLQPAPAVSPGPGPGDGPALLWSLRRDDGLQVTARGAGTLVVRDVGPLTADPLRGATQLHVLECTSGRADGTRFEPADCTRVVLDDHGPLVAAGGRLVADAGWSVPLLDGEEPAARVDGGLVLQRRGGAARCVSLDDGRERWSRHLSDLVYTAHDVARLRWCAQVHVSRDENGERLRVDVVDPAAGDTVATLPVVELPPVWHGGEWLVVVSGLDRPGGFDAGGGHVVLRARVPYEQHRLAYGDLMVGPHGHRFLDPEPRRSEAPMDSTLTFASDAHAGDRVFRRASYPTKGRCRLETLDGSVLWTRPGDAVVRGRVGALSVVESHGELEAVDDDGRSAWRRPGRVLDVGRGAVWSHHDGVLAVTAVETGAEVAGIPLAGAPPRVPGRFDGLDPDDDVLVLSDDERVDVYALS